MLDEIVLNSEVFKIIYLMKYLNFLGFNKMLIAIPMISSKIFGCTNYVCRIAEIFGGRNFQKFGKKPMISKNIFLNICSCCI